MLQVGAICFNVFTQLSGNLRIPSQQLFTGHFYFTWSPSGRNDIFGIGECFFYIGSKREFNFVETAMTHFFINSFYSGSVNIV